VRDRASRARLTDLLLLGADLSLEAVIAGGAWWEPDAAAGVARRRE